MKLPSGFERIEVDGAVVVARHGLAGRLVQAGVQDPHALVLEAPAEVRGRMPLARVDLGSEGTALVRSLQRGGLFGKVVRRLSLDPWRSLAELVVSAEAAARGASVLDVLAAVTRPKVFGYHHGLVTREVEGARDLMRLLREEPPGAVRRAALSAAGRAVRTLHDAGVDHVDLNLKNVLLAPDGHAIVIDLDRCRIGIESLAWPVRRRNLLRLLRSWTKLQSVHPTSTFDSDLLRFARAYAPADRDLLRRIVRARARFPLRRLLWGLFPPRIL